ncbi:N-6 DNA methylase [Shewanella gelidii]|uniref:site-specific DNA-methyltransferase (adenine-specific) n=1 Tax=Shewanella gelidii TaxID=1642821 RepID=A0A917JHB9_9GAMM|nr:N-6 DNA methylase [Shewanella gelidii]MCL1096543.1 N-6 DNA methylase [Shewanella gelidii]GGI68266.1 hypothetical protein GCM10009332_01770 [Shewanella gelidii]
MEKHEEVHRAARAQAKEIWKLLEYIRGAAPISDYRSLAYAILFIRYLQDISGKHFEAPGFYTFDEIRSHIHSLTSHCIDLGLLPTNLGHIASESIQEILLKNNRIDEESVRLAIRGKLVNRHKDVARFTLSELNSLFAENESKSGSEFYTPRDVNRLVTTLGLNYSPRSVCDPFAGGGSTAFSFHEAMKGQVRVDTQEMNPDIYFQLVVTRILRQIGGDDFLEDSISNPKLNSELYDLVVSFPPFGLKLPISLRERLFHDSSRPWLWLGEKLPASRSDWVTTLSMLPPLNNKTKLIIGMSLSALTRTGSEASVRKVLSEQNIIDTVILLPKGIHYSTGIATVLLVFDMNPQQSQNKVRFVDASLFYQPRRGRNILAPENIERIVESCISDGRFSKTATLDEIAQNKFNLNPSLYVEKTIKVSQVKLTNFRGYTDFTVPIHESLTVLVGENGAGKTSILEAISCGLGPFLTAMPEAKGKLIRKSDIHVGSNGVADFARISMDTASSLSWDLVTKGSDRNTLAKIGTQALSDFASQIVDNMDEYPLIAYYGTNRALSSSSGKVSISPFEEAQRSEGYDSALDAKINYGSLKNWFSKIEVDELKLRDEKKTHSFSHPAKALVKTAVKQIVERAEDVAFDKTINDVVVSWRNENDEVISLGLEQLSEGYRNMVALTIDLVRRAYLLNPTSKYPLDVSGVVIIDEIELHLHPRWQQKILGDLRDLFKSIQFIVTTHSPQVLTTVNVESIRIVSADAKEAKQLTGTSTYGAESSRMLEDVLGGSTRPQHIEIVRKLNRYTELVESDQWDSDEALGLREILYKWGGQTEAELQRLETDIRIREFERDNEKNQ